MLKSKYKTPDPYQCWVDDKIAGLNNAISRIGRRRQTEIIKKQVYALLKVKEVWERLKK